MARLTPKQKAQQCALRGETAAAVEQFNTNLKEGDFGAAASLAEIEAFRGNWDSVLRHAYLFMPHLDSVYAGNVFGDIANLVALVGLTQGAWPAIEEEIKGIRAQLATNPRWERFANACDRLMTLSASHGNSSYVWDLGKHSDLDEDQRTAKFDAGVASIFGKKKRPFKSEAERRTHLFSLASNLGAHRVAVRLHDEEGIDDIILFNSIAFVASSLSLAERVDDAWKVIEKGFHLWWPVDVAQVAPVVLLTDPGLRPLMTPERCAWVLATARGPEGAKGK